MAEKPRVHNQGKCIVQPEEVGSPVLLILFPDGSVDNALSQAKAETKCKKWFEKNGDSNALNFGLVEWRNVPGAPTPSA